MRVALVCAGFVALASAPAAAEDGLDRAAISDGVAKAKAQVVACGDKSQTGGTVKAKVTVGPDGKVKSATAAGSGNPALDTCVADVMKRVTFKATTAGGSFSYPFVFGAKPAAPAPPPVEFDAAAIASGMAKIKPQIAACGDHPTMGGTYTLVVTVDASGKVTSAGTKGNEDISISACMTSVMTKATFERTKSGGSFTYPVVFPKIAEVPDELDRTAISSGIGKLKSKIRACADRTHKGTVKLAVTVAGDGTVSAATVKQAPDEGLGKCVAGVVAKATFAKTTNGGSFTYPFVF